MTQIDDEALRIEHLTKVYKDFWGRDKVRALDDLNMNVHRGEVFGLLGPNGSGKSTTIKLLLGLIFPTAGSAHILGHPAGSTAINEKIGFLPEESYLYRFLNGEETLRFYGRLFKIPHRELKRRVPELLDIVGLDAKARKRKLREYSKGMARRIGTVAGAAGLACTVGSNLELGIASAAMIHLGMVLPPGSVEAFPCDILSTFFYEDMLLQEPLPVVAGSAKVPSGPGLGVSLDAQRVEHYRVK